MADATVANKDQKVVNLSQLGMPQLEQIKTQLEEVRSSRPRISHGIVVPCILTGASASITFRCFIYMGEWHVCT